MNKYFFLFICKMQTLRLLLALLLCPQHSDDNLLFFYEKSSDDSENIQSTYNSMNTNSKTNIFFTTDLSKGFVYGNIFLHYINHMGTMKV